MPRVIRLAEEYHRRAGAGSVAVVQVSEQEIMDSMLLANRHGHIACTQGGESLAGLRAALKAGLLGKNETAVLDATAHHLKFIGFQQMYFEDSFPPEFEVTPKAAYQNRPQLLTPKTDKPEEKTADLAGQIAAVAGVDAERVAGLPYRRRILFFFKAWIIAPGGKMQTGKLWAMRLAVGLILVITWSCGGKDLPLVDKETLKSWPRPSSTYPGCQGAQRLECQ